MLLKWNLPLRFVYQSEWRTWSTLQDGIDFGSLNAFIVEVH